MKKIQDNYFLSSSDSESGKFWFLNNYVFLEDDAFESEMKAAQMQ